MEQEIKFCTTSDNVRIAYSSVGEGPPFVKAANWMNHLEYDWQSPAWNHLLHEFADDHQLIATFSPAAVKVTSQVTVTFLLN